MGCRTPTLVLRLRDEETRAPEILDEPIDRPIFITGLPRSGTTFLHHLLTADQANQVARVWQLIHPYPAPGSNAVKDHRRVARQLRMFEILSPEFRQLHPIKAGSPLTAHTLASLRFDTTYCVPSYRRWLDRIGHFESFRFHKRFLQHLQHQAGGPRRWVLKCPDHVFALSEIQAIYPDARFVFVHRDPLSVVSSVVRLTEVLRRPFAWYIDRPALARQECERWSEAADLMMRAADQEPFADPIFHLQYRDLVSDPVGAVEKLYRHFGLALKEKAVAAMAKTVETNPNGGYGSTPYRLDDYDIDPGTVYERFGSYMTRFGTPPEPDRTARKPSLLPPIGKLSTQTGV